MAKPLSVYFSPTQTNKTFVEKFHDDRRFNFKPLMEEEPYRIRQLAYLSAFRDEPMAFLWGNGYAHHESFYFTRDAGLTKLNVDQHSDASLASSFPSPNCGNHMSCTQSRGVRIVTPISSSWDITHTLNDPTLQSERVALTIDCDAITGFPACPVWLTEHGLMPAEVVRLVRLFGSRIARLDIGGLVEYLPRFDLLDNLPIPTPTHAEAFAVSNLAAEWVNWGFDKNPGSATVYSNDGSGVRVVRNVPISQVLSQITMDRVASYAFHAYHEVLKAYAEAIASN